MIAVSNATRYRRVDGRAALVLREIDLTVTSKSRIGVYGGAGAGKSTLARLACKVENTDFGSVTHSCSVSWPIGLSAFLHKEMTGTENVNTLTGLLGGDRARTLAFVSAFTRLGPILNRKVVTYSSFERDRLAIGCCFAFHFGIYVVDGLPSLGDPQFQSRCLAELRRRMRSSGLLFFSKNRRHLELMCDKHYALCNGALVPAQSAGHAEMLARSSMSKEFV